MTALIAGILFAALTVLLRYKSKACTKGSGPEAIEACSFMINYFPADFMKVLFLSTRVSHYEKAGNKTEALADLVRIAKLWDSGRVKASDKTRLFVYDRLATLNSELGKEADVKKYSDLAIKIGTKEPAVYVSRAAFYINTMQYREAIEDLKQAEQMGYDKPPLFFNYGAAYLKLGDHASAFPRLYKAEQLMSAPEDKARLNRMLGQACFETKRDAEARQRLQSVLDSGVPCPECSEMVAIISQRALPAPAVKPRARSKRPRARKTRQKSA
ncbi:MAG: hypothetical protein Q7R35_12695 [Elusimicrobiota bacterium]|nr:hypothetical protein [Elusimicrobiota bacterium]